MADADLLPFQFADQADTIHTYLGELKTLLNNKRDEVKERNKEIDEGVYQALNDPKKHTVPPPVEPIPPYLNFAPLDQASDDLTTAAKEFDEAFAAAAGNAPADVNLALIQSERTLTNADGLPHRPWFQNLIYAPGFYTGYGVKTIPGVREAIEQKDWKEADAQIVKVAAALESEAELLKQAKAKLPQSAAR